jgi:hypothetical protein
MMGDWSSFSRMRGEYGRTWFRCSDLIEAMSAEGRIVTRWMVRKAIRGLPRPVKRYGHYRYSQEHMDAVRAYAGRMGAIEEMTHV